MHALLTVSVFKIFQSRDRKGALLGRGAGRPRYRNNSIETPKYPASALA